MRNGFGAALVAIAFFCLARTSFGATMLTLSSPNDLNNLTVGEVVTIDVTLSGLLNPPDVMDFLAATVEFDPVVFGTPTITDGPIVPDPSGVVMFEASGLADYSYDDNLATSGLTIVANGLFFSFETPVVNAGSGEIFLTHVDSVGQGDEGDLPVVVGGSALQYSATAINPVPTPSSGVAWVGLFAMGLVGRWRRRRRRQGAVG